MALSELGVGGVAQTLRDETFAGKTLFVPPTPSFKTSLSIMGIPMSFNDETFDKGSQLPMMLLAEQVTVLYR